jgi:molybdenum cofactor cytidylyltransferase
VVQYGVRVVAVILAAGEARRMGRPKALLRLGESTFLARTAATLHRPGVASVVVVLGHEADRIVAESGLPAGVELLRNPRPADGMLSSVLAGLAAAEERSAEAILLQPVDHPLVAPATVDAVLQALGSGAVVAVPSHGGRRGHPAGFARAAWPALRSADPRRGARMVLADHPEWVVHVSGDPGSVRGFDTLGDYERLVSEAGSFSP